MFDWAIIIGIGFPVLWMIWDIKKELIKKMDNMEMELHKLTDHSAVTLEPWKKK